MANGHPYRNDIRYMECGGHRRKDRPGGRSLRGAEVGRRAIRDRPYGAGVVRQEDTKKDAPTGKNRWGNPVNPAKLPCWCRRRYLPFR